MWPELSSCCRSAGQRLALTVLTLALLTVTVRLGGFLVPVFVVIWAVVMTTVPLWQVTSLPSTKTVWPSSSGMSLPSLSVVWQPPGPLTQDGRSRRPRGILRP